MLTEEADASWHSVVWHRQQVFRSFGVAAVYRHYADQLAQDSALPQPPQQSSKANLLQPQLQASSLQLQQQATHSKMEQAEQTPVSDAVKSDADKDNWSAQLRAACHTLGQEHVTNLDAAKDELARALMYLRSTEHTLRGLKRQTEAVTGMPSMLLFIYCLVPPKEYLTPLLLLRYCLYAL